MKKLLITASLTVLVIGGFAIGKIPYFKDDLVPVNDQVQPTVIETKEPEVIRIFNTVPVNVTMPERVVEKLITVESAELKEKVDNLIMENKNLNETIKKEKAPVGVPGTSVENKKGGITASA